MDSASKAASGIMSSAKGTVDRVSKALGNQDKFVSLLVIFLAFVLLIYVVILLVRQFYKTSLTTVTMLGKKPLQIVGNKSMNISSNVKLPAQNNGKEFSVSFWIYVDGNSLDVTVQPKFVMGRAVTDGAVVSSHPLFYIAPETNRLYCIVRKVGDSAFDTLSALHEAVKDLPSTLKLDYLPMQRWVNVLLVVDNNYVQLFMDGELHQVEDVTVLNEKRVVLDSSGDFFVGAASQASVSFAGYLSKVQWSNYALTLDHAKMVYASGPMPTSPLASLGLPMYTLRSPFVRVDSVTQVAEDVTD